MRLRTTLNTIDQALPRLTLVAEGKLLPNGQPGLLIQRVEEMRSALMEIATLPCFALAAGALLADPLLRVPGDTIHANQESGKAFGEGVTLLQNNAERLSVTMHAVLGEELPDVISVKLPPIQTLVQLETRIKQLVLILERPVQFAFGTTVEFAGFDMGTAWVNFKTATKAAQFIGALVLAGQTFAARHVQLQRFAEGARALQYETNMLQKIDETHAAALETLARELAEDVVKTKATDAADRTEAINATVAAIKELSSMFRDQAEIHLALTAKDELSSFFPSPAAVSSLFPAPADAGRLAPTPKEK